jgi:protein mago nashi
MVDELRRIVKESEIMREDDAKWPKKNVAGRQELEVRLGKEHISFEVSTLSLSRHQPLLAK